MHWSKYEVFSVLSGIVLLALAVAPDIKASDRFWAVTAGALSIGYGIYVAKQDSGTYTFSVMIFVIPFLCGAALIHKIAKARRGDERERR